MRWLIVEDSLRDRRGHWFEYIKTIRGELRKLGDEVTVLVDAEAESFIVRELDARPVLPKSIWHRMSDRAGRFRRLVRVPVHAWRTRRCLQAWFRENPASGYDVIFVPTVLVHHMLGWKWLVKSTLRNSKARVLLFFPNTPIRINPETGKSEWDTSITTRLFRRVVRSLSDEVASGCVVLGAETHPMRDALTELSGVPFSYLPHPVVRSSKPLAASSADAGSDGILMGCYGGARIEKGHDVLVAAVDQYCREDPESDVRFAIQCVDSDGDYWHRLRGNPKVDLIEGYFDEGGYSRALGRTGVLLLPYRFSSYALRVSRVVIEAMVAGIPIVATDGTTLSQQAEEFGAALGCTDGNVESLVAAIGEMERRFDEIRELARSRMEVSARHFSVETFRELLTATNSEASGRV